MSSEQRAPQTKDGSGSSQNRSNRRGRGRRSRSGGGNRGGRGPSSEPKRDYLPSDAELAEEEASLEAQLDDDAETIVVRELKAKAMPELLELALEMDVENAGGLRKRT